jgi:hypothetical protein
LCFSEGEDHVGGGAGVFAGTTINSLMSFSGADVPSAREDERAALLGAKIAISDSPRMRPKTPIRTAVATMAMAHCFS